MASSRAVRLHHRERVIRNRMRFLDEVWRLHEGRYSNRNADGSLPWFVPGRFAKIHPGRVCSCEWCTPRYGRARPSDLRRMIDDEEPDERA